MDKLLLEKIESLYKSLNSVSDRLPDNTIGTVNNNDSQEDNDEIDLRELFGILIDSKWLIISITLIMLLLGITKAILDAPVYRLDALLQIEEASATLGLGDIDPMAGLMDTQASVEAEIGIIKSRMVLGEAVSNLNMDIVVSPKYFPVFGKTIARKFTERHPDKISEPLFGYTKYAWGGEQIKVQSLYVPARWKDKKITLITTGEGKFSILDSDNELIAEGDVGKPLIASIKDEKAPFRLFISLLKARPGTHFILSKMTELNAIDLLEEKFNVLEEGKQTGILGFSMESTTPVYAMQTLNEIANIYVRQNVEQKSAEAQQTLEFLESQLPKVKNQLEVSTTALNEYRLKKGSIDLNIETEGVLTGVVALNTEITVLQQKKDELNRNFTEFHPTVIAIDKQISRLRSQLKSQNERIEELPETQQVILRLTRDVEVDTQLYTALLNQLQTIKVTKAGTVGNVRIIDYAVLPTIPVKPKKILIVAIALIFGFVLGIATAFIRKAMRNGVEDPSVIEKNLNIPVYATVPHSDFQQRESKKLRHKKEEDIYQYDSQELRMQNDDQYKQILDLQVLALHHPDDLAVESLRSLRTTLHFAFLEAKNNIILISGPSPGIGKSFISINLAVVLAQTGKKVLLIDADMRKGLLNKTLGVSREHGLSDLISSSLEPAEVIKTIQGAEIDFISTGEIPPNPSELLLHERFEKVLEICNEMYDLVIVDSPPILAVTDASIIGRMASVSLLVIKSGQHPISELELCAKRFKQNKVDIKGIVINDLPLSLSTNYGYEKYTYN
ncbi:MAG: polysaccharide biosynthesis tyrosine autokinase [Methylococcales bacterium]|nr:polysaccharide biosynthesis tyrosine autokinase [Methylococcales bacterium]